MIYEELVDTRVDRVLYSEKKFLVGKEKNPVKVLDAIKEFVNILEDLVKKLEKRCKRYDEFYLPIFTTKKLEEDVSTADYLREYVYRRNLLYEQACNLKMGFVTRDYQIFDEDIVKIHRVNGDFYKNLKRHNLFESTKVVGFHVICQNFLVCELKTIQRMFKQKMTKQVSIDFNFNFSVLSD